MGIYLNQQKKEALLPWLVFPVMVCIVSWIHFYLSQSLAVDGNSLNPFALRLFFFVIICGSFIYYYSRLYHLLILSDEVSFGLNLRKLSYLHLIISFFTLPLFSNDFFSLIGYADSFINGFNIYTSFDAASQTEYTPLINPMYQKLNCKYGPINMMIMLPSILWNQHSMLASIFITKTILLCFGILYIEFSLKLSHLVAEKYKYVLLLFPIWFIQGIGQFHLDIIGVSFVLIGYYYCYQNKNIIGILFLVLAALSKITYVLFLGIPFLLLLEKSENIELKAFLRYSFLILFYSLTLGFLTYNPFIDRWQELLAPIQAMNTERPSSTMADIGAYILLLWNDDFTSNYTVTIKIFKLIGFFVMLLMVGYYLKNYSKNNSHRLFLLSIFSTLILVYSHRFLPWYLMVMPLLLYLGNRKDWLKWFLFISFFSMFQDFAIFIHTDNMIGAILMAFATFITVSLYLYKLNSRRRYE